MFCCCLIWVCYFAVFNLLGLCVCLIVCLVFVEFGLCCLLF